MPELDAARRLLPAPAPQQTAAFPLIEGQSLANRAGTVQAVGRGRRTDLLRVHLWREQRPRRNAANFDHDAGVDDLATGLDDPAAGAARLSTLCGLSRSGASTVAAAHALLGPAAGNYGRERRWARRQLLHHREWQRRRDRARAQSPTSPCSTSRW